MLLFYPQIELIEDVFAEDEIDEIWITFPDPQIKYKRTKHRLTNPAFLNRYRHILKPEGRIHLKTDMSFCMGIHWDFWKEKVEVDYAHHDVYESTCAKTRYSHTNPLREIIS